MEKKIGILTFSYGSNYGGTLQCLALYKTIKKMGYKNVEIIKYVPQGAYSYKKKFLIGTGLTKDLKKNLTNIKTIIKKMKIKFKYVDSILEKFELFRNEELKLTELTNDNNFEDVVSKFDYIIVGSDQVWNVADGMDDKYFLTNIAKFKGKRISYAACSGINFYHEKDEEKLKSALRNFDSISVRNNHTFEFVKKLINKESIIVADPTILYSFEEYSLKNKEIKAPYILTYILSSEIDGGHEEVLKRIKNIYGDLHIVAVGIPYAGSGGLNFYEWADEVLYDIEPQKWLNLIENAAFIYTDSYHGVIFSMKYKKNFLAYYSEKIRAGRFVDLSSRYGIDDFIVESVKDIDKKKSLQKNPNYELINKLLLEHKMTSIEYLKNIFSKNME